MGRPVLVDREEIKKLIDIYFHEECFSINSSPLLKISAICEYINIHGYPQVSEHYLRVNFKSYIDSLRSSEAICTTSTYEKQTILYRDIDIKKFVSRNNTTSKMITALSERETYYKKVYEASVNAHKRNQALQRENSELRHKLKVLEQELLDSAESAKEGSDKYKKAIAENSILRGVLKTYVYPAAATTLLQQAGFRFEDSNNDIVDINVLNQEKVDASTKITNNIVRGLFDRIK